VLQPGDDQEPQLEQLPEECVREVMLRLSDHKDLARAGEAWHVMQRVLDEQRIWRQLCNYHFKTHLINKLFEDAELTEPDYQSIYHKLRK
jgi:F-box protein 25/32